MLTTPTVVPRSEIAQDILNRIIHFPSPDGRDQQVAVEDPVPMYQPRPKSMLRPFPHAKGKEMDHFHLAAPSLEKVVMGRLQAAYDLDRRVSDALVTLVDLETNMVGTENVEMYALLNEAKARLTVILPTLENILGKLKKGASSIELQTLNDTLNITLDDETVAFFHFIEVSRTIAPRVALETLSYRLGRTKTHKRGLACDISSETRIARRAGQTRVIHRQPPLTIRVPPLKWAHVATPLSRPAPEA
ncbi:hypothetical protein D9611_010794 [Ephemerocybe angulata]|uniref:Uncharacterized protein n=1 Tax=Ephemerocybe angulata TaxID=980116 RepID=A0A8H5BBS9_9AGAR|nr:hypothetical protein D9611_010794 [Tulosesus angulatus]